jgi:hypothetical protein
VLIQAADKKEFFVHKNLISFFSRPFKQQFEKNPVAWLPNTSANVFRLAYRWLYTGVIWSKDVNEVRPPTRAFIKLYTFAEEAEMSSLQDAAMAFLLETGRTDIETCKSAAGYVFKHTRPDSPLRRFITDVLVWHDDNIDYNKVKSLTVKICISIMEGMQKRLSSTEGNPLDNESDYLLLGGNKPEQPKNAHIPQSINGQKEENQRGEIESAKLVKDDTEAFKEGQVKVAQTHIRSYQSMANAENEGRSGLPKEEVIEADDVDIKPFEKDLVKAVEEVDTKVSMEDYSKKLVKGSEENVAKAAEVNTKVSMEDYSKKLVKESEENVAEAAEVDGTSEAAEAVEVDMRASEASIVNEAVYIKEGPTREIAVDIEMPKKDVPEVAIEDIRPSEKDTIEGREAGTKASSEDSTRGTVNNIKVLKKGVAEEDIRTFGEGTIKVEGAKVSREDNTEEVKDCAKDLQKDINGVPMEGVIASENSTIKEAKEISVEVPVEEAKEIKDNIEVPGFDFQIDLPDFEATNNDTIKETKEVGTTVSNENNIQEVPEFDFQIDLSDFGATDNNAIEETKEVGTTVSNENNIQEVPEFDFQIDLSDFGATDNNAIEEAREIGIKVSIEETKEVGTEASNENNIQEVKDVKLPENDIEVDMEDAKPIEKGEVQDANGIDNGRKLENPNEITTGYGPPDRRDAFTDTDLSAPFKNIPNEESIDREHWESSEGHIRKLIMDFEHQGGRVQFTDPNSSTPFKIIPDQEPAKGGDMDIGANKGSREAEDDPKASTSTTKETGRVSKAYKKKKNQKNKNRNRKKKARAVENNDVKVPEEGHTTKEDKDENNMAIVLERMKREEAEGDKRGTEPRKGPAKTRYMDDSESEESEYNTEEEIMAILEEELTSELTAEAIAEADRRREEEKEKETEAKAQKMMEKLIAQDSQNRREMLQKEKNMVDRGDYTSDILYAGRYPPGLSPAIQPTMPSTMPVMSSASFGTFQSIPPPPTMPSTMPSTMPVLPSASFGMFQPLLPPLPQMPPPPHSSAYLQRPPPPSQTIPVLHPRRPHPPPPTQN